MAALAQAQPTDSPNHPDAARETQARWDRLTLLDRQTRDMAQRDAARHRREVVSLQFSANGWGIIIKPDGAVALVRQVDGTNVPAAVFAPASTVNFGRLQSQIEKAWERKRATRDEVAFLAGFKLAGEPRIELAPVFDVQLWNDVINAIEGKIPADSMASLRRLAAQAPLQIVPIAAKQR